MQLFFCSYNLLSSCRAWSSYVLYLGETKKKILPTWTVVRKWWLHKTKRMQCALGSATTFPNKWYMVWFSVMPPCASRVKWWALEGRTQPCQAKMWQVLLLKGFNHHDQDINFFVYHTHQLEDTVTWSGNHMFQWWTASIIHIRLSVLVDYTFPKR